MSDNANLLDLVGAGELRRLARYLLDVSAATV